MRRLPLARVLLATAVLAVCALGWAGLSADASTAQLTHHRLEKAEAIATSVELDQQRVASLGERDGEVDTSSIRSLDAPHASESPQTRPAANGNGRASAALLAAFLLAAAVVALVAAASRVRSSWPA